MTVFSYTLNFIVSIARFKFPAGLFPDLSTPEWNRLLLFAKFSCKLLRGQSKGTPLLVIFTAKEANTNKFQFLFTYWFSAKDKRGG